MNNEIFKICVYNKRLFLAGSNDLCRFLKMFLVSQNALLVFSDLT